jgi:glycosyltransferase involved in cell wall biosynthesis
VSQHFVDVLLPVHNGASTIADSVESVRRQTIRDLHIIIVDDGSTDETPRILKRLVRADDRITVLNQRNGGIVEALNAGLELCRSEFIARQDADDISDASRIATQLSYLMKHPDCLALSGATRHIDAAGRFTGYTHYFPAPTLADATWAPQREPYLCHPFLMVRRRAIQSVGGYRYVFNSEDTDLYWRLSEKGRLHNLEEVLGDYRMHDRSISGGSIENGRIAALSSQLAGLSAQRRRSGRPDVRFEKEAIAEYRREPTLAKIYELGRQQFDDDEAGYLRIAMAAKLLDLTFYRPFELELEDCIFIRQARSELSKLSQANRLQLDRLYMTAIIRLLRKGLRREAVALTPPALYAPTAARLLFATLPDGPRQALNRLRKVRMDEMRV